MSHRISEASTVFSCYLPPYHLNSSYPRNSDFQTICLEGVIKTPVETEVCWPQYVGPGKNFVWATKKNNSDTIHWILVGCSSNVAGALLWCPLATATVAADASDPVAPPEVMVFAATVAADGKRSSGKFNALTLTSGFSSSHFLSSPFESCVTAGLKPCQIQYNWAVQTIPYIYSIQSVFFNRSFMINTYPLTLHVTGNIYL